MAKSMPHSCPIWPPHIAVTTTGTNTGARNGSDAMDLTTITFDQMAMAVMALIAVREVMIVALPDRIAGPGGWLVDTRKGDRNHA